MATSELRVIRRALARHEGGRGKRYPTALRNRIGAWVRAQRGRRMSWEAISSELELCVNTLRRWAGDGGPRRARRSKPVEVVAESGSVSVVSPSGYRVEGLSVRDAALLLRELS